MSVLSDASSALGVPVWGVSIAAGIVALAALVDHSMRPEAKAQIGDFLDHGRIAAETPTVVKVIRTAFEATFGERQFSWRCVERSVVFSVFTAYAIALLIWSKHGGEVRSRMPNLPSLPAMVVMSLPGVVIFTGLQNWLSIGKTRLMLNWMRHTSGVAALLAFMLLDLVLSYVITMVLYWGPGLALYGRAGLCDTWQDYDAAVDCAVLRDPVGIVGGILAITHGMSQRVMTNAGAMTPANILNYAQGLTTEFTSIWTVLVVASLFLLKALAPLGAARRAVRWAFDLRSSPVLAVGWIAAVLVWLGSLAFALA
jgi:hypothetical protein